MTDQELLKEIQENAGTYEDFTARTTAVFTAAKAYADARVSACYKGIITQSELGSILAAYKAKNAGIDHVTQVVMDVVYSNVAAKDADLKRITHERDVLCEIRDMSYREIAALKADNARMREGILDIKGNPSKYFEEDYPLPEHPDRMQLKTNYVAFNALLSPADDTYDSGKFGAPNNLDRPSTECLCSHTIDGRLVKQCDNCRNKPFAPADGVLVSTKPDIETQQEDVMVVGNCANCGVEFHIHKQDSPADGDGVEETPKVDLAYSAFRHAVSALYFSDSADYPRKLYQIIIDYKRLTDGVSDYLLTEYFYETHPECAIDRHKEEL